MDSKQNSSKKNLQYSQSYSTSTQLENTPLLPKHPGPPNGSSFNKIILLCKGPDRLWSTSLIALMAALTALLGGYTIGYPSSSLLELNNLTTRAISNGSVLENVYGAFAPLGALFGATLAGSSADILGRKLTLILTAVPYFIGWTLIGISWFITNPPAFKTIIIIGRFISGFGLGWAMFSGPVYIGEISPPSLRGLYSSLPQLLLNVGVLIVYGLGAIHACKYYMTAFVATAITLMLVLGVFWLPETPRFLISKGKIKQSLKNLEFLRGPKVNVQQEMIEIQEGVNDQKKLTFVEVLKEMTHRNIYIPFLMMLLVMVFQQLSGINALVFYGVHILQKAGFGENSNYVALFTIGLTAVIFTFVNTVTVDLFGRKILLIASGVIMTFSATGLGYAIRYSNVSALEPLAIMSVIGFEVGFSIGFGAIPWIMVAELIPLRVRGVLGGILAGINWGLAAIITGFYLVYANKIGADMAWWTFAFFNIIGVGLIALFLPETKGKSLEVMEQQMMKGFKICS